MESINRDKHENTDLEAQLVSLKTLATSWDVDRGTARRILRNAGIRPIILGMGRNGSIRYALAEIQGWLKTRQRAS